MAKLCAVVTSSLRLFQGRLPLNFNEFVPDLCDLAKGRSQSILLLKSYSTTFLVKRSHIYGGLKWLIVLYIPRLVFATFSCELSKFLLFARVHQALLRYHYYKLFSLNIWSFYLLIKLLICLRSEIAFVLLFALVLGLLVQPTRRP